MARPHIVRADTIDLQDHEAPSAKDHPRQTQSTATLAPHQAETLREVAQETAEANSQSPRLSWANGADSAGDPQQQAGDLAAGVNQRLNGDGSRNGDSNMHAEDNLAVAQNGGSSGREDDSDTGGDTDESMDDDMMDKISSSPSIEDEDIDFEFVYALHTFVATVEGQANATKGDTMVLLDDSNSYWWLVRVVKDSSIGYLPAEHIETPTERLARLNKHRNIDLSASMLQDQTSEKAKSTFRLRGKKKKNVVFAEPTYVDYSDFDDYSSEEEEEAGGPFGPQQDGNGTKDAADKQQEQASGEQTKVKAEGAMDDESAKVEPLKPRGQKEAAAASEPLGESPDEAEVRRSSEQFFETRAEGPSRSRNGTVRNTDSFFKDETVETKKITLTPNLLRDDNQPRPSSDSTKESKRPSLDKVDKMERELQADKKDDKKKKDKKPSAIRSFFSRKDKKKANDDDDDSLGGKRSLDASLDGDEEDASIDRNAPQRQPSKLQKAQPRAEPSPTRKAGTAVQKSSTRELAEYIASEGRTNDVSNVPPSSMRIVQEKETMEASRERSPELNRSASQQKEERSGLSKIKLSRSASNDKPNKADKPQKVVKAKSRVELDDFDTSDEDVTTTAEPVRQPEQAQQQNPQQQAPSGIMQNVNPSRPQLPGAFPDSYMTTSSNQSDKTITAADPQPAQQNPAADRLSESPVQVSPVTSTNPPALVGDTSSQDGHSNSPSPELVEAEDAQRHRAQDSSVAGSTTTGTSQASSTWNDTKLREFFETSNEIRDMLVVVYDKSDVAPAGPDHPVAGTLFREQNAKLAEITTQLDNMLGDWLARKQRLRGTV